MIKSQYTKGIGHQYRDNGVSVGKFVYSTGTSTWSKYSTLNNICHPNMNISRTTLGEHILSFETCRLASVEYAAIDPRVTTFESLRTVRISHITEAEAQAGSCALNTYSASALADPTDGSVLTVILNQAKTGTY